MILNRPCRRFRTRRVVTKTCEAFDTVQASPLRLIAFRVVIICFSKDTRSRALLQRYLYTFPYVWLILQYQQFILYCMFALRRRRSHSAAL